MRIRAQIIGSVMAVVALVCAVFMAYVLHRQGDQSHRALNERIETAGERIRQTFPGPFYDGNIEQLNANLDSIFRDPDLVELSLTEYKGNIRLERRREIDAAGGEALQRTVEVRRGIDTLGAVRLVYTTANIERRIAESRNEMLLFAAVMMMGVALVILLVARGFTRPIDRLTQAARAIADGNLEQPIDRGGAEELAILADSFSRMRDAIRDQIRDLAQRNAQLNTEVAERLHAEDVLRVSEARYRALAENIPQRIYYKDSGLRYVAANRRYAEDFGMAPEALVGKDDFDLFPREIAERYRDDDRRVMGSGQASEGDEQYLQRGVALTVRTVKTPVRDDTGRVVGVCGIFANVTAQRELESRLRDSEATLRAIYETAREGILVVDADSGRFVMTNPGMCGLTGYSEAELLTKLPPDLHPPEVQERLASVFAAMADGTFGITTDLPFRRKDGSIIYADVSAAPVRIRDKACFLGIFRDVTERWQAQQRLQQLNDELESRVAQRTLELATAKDEADRANVAKSEFLSRMSHELRTPLNAILGFGQLLAREPLDVLQADNVGEILQSGQHLLNLINEILDLARVESGKFSISREPVPLLQLVDECVALIGPQAEARGIRLVESENDCELTALADRTRLKQVLLNLLSNAVKYNHPQGSVGIVCIADGGSVQLRVSDTGPGLTPEQQARLFVPFERLEADRTDVEGTGIGLALSQRLMTLMQGEIGVESTPGVGSTFWIRLPLASVPGTERAAPVPEVSAAAPAGGGNWEVLCIEDNPANLRLLERILAPLDGVSLLAAAAPARGLELARERHPALILLDINLPDMDGYAVLRCLRESDATRDIPVVAVSANAMPKDVERGKAAGFTDYLTKPVDVDRLKQTVAALLAAADPPRDRRHG